MVSTWSKGGVYDCCVGQNSGMYVGRRGRPCGKHVGRRGGYDCAAWGKIVVSMWTEGGVLVVSMWAEGGGVRLRCLGQNSGMYVGMMVMTFKNCFTHTHT